MSQSRHDFLIVSHLCRPRTNGQSIFRPWFIEPRFRCEGVFMFVEFRHASVQFGSIRALFPRRLVKPSACSARLVLSGVAVLRCALLHCNLAGTLWRLPESPHTQHSADWLFPAALFPQVNKIIEHLFCTMAHSLTLYGLTFNLCTKKYGTP